MAPNNERTGLAKSLSVMPGDTIKMEVYAKYLIRTRATEYRFEYADQFDSKITPPLQAHLLMVDLQEVREVLQYHGQVFWIRVRPPNTAPKAYLNYIVFDRTITMSRATSSH